MELHLADKHAKPGDVTGQCRELAQVHNSADLSVMFKKQLDISLPWTTDAPWILLAKIFRASTVE